MFEKFLRTLGHLCCQHKQKIIRKVGTRCFFECFDCGKEFDTGLCLLPTLYTR